MPLPRSRPPQVGNRPLLHAERVAVQSALRMDRFLARLEYAGLSSDESEAAYRYAVGKARTSRENLDSVLDRIATDIASTGRLPSTVQEAA